MPGNAISKMGAAKMRGTILQLRKKLTAAQAELAVVRSVIRAARIYITTGRDTELRRVMAEIGFEEPPPRKCSPRPERTRQPVSEGRSFEACEDYEIL